MSKPLQIILLTQAEEDFSLLSSCLKNAGYDPTLTPVTSAAVYETLLQEQAWDAILWGSDRISLEKTVTVWHQHAPFTPLIVLTEDGEIALEAARLGAAVSSVPHLAAVLEHELRHVQEQELLRGQLNELSSLYRATSILFANLISNSLHEVARQIIEAVTKAFGKVECGVLLLKDDQQLTCIAGTPHYQTSLLVSEVIHTGQVVYIPDVTQAKQLQGAALRFCSELILPLETPQKVIGALDLQSTAADSFTDQERRTLYSFAVRAATAIENVRLYETVQQAALALERRVAERTAQLGRTIEQVEAILNSSSEAIVLTKVDGTIRQTNPAFDELFGFGIDEVFGYPIARMLAPSHAVKFMPIFYAVVNGKVKKNIEVVARRKDGTTFDAEVGLSVIDDNDSLRVVCTFHDISKHLEIEDTLREALERERELNELKTRFITMVSHEFRTPLATILVTVDSLRSYIDRMTSEQRDRKFNKIETQIRHMTDLLENVLALSQDNIGPTTTQQDSSSLDEICQALVDDLRGTTAHQLVFKCEGDCKHLQLDPGFVRQMVSALLSNAIKFSPKGGLVQLLLDGTGDEVVIQVTDEGIGIPEADQQHLFKAFHRAKNVDTIPGTGMELALVKQAVEQVGGTIHFESTVGAGTTFTVTLPRGNTP